MRDMVFRAFLSLIYGEITSLLRGINVNALYATWNRMVTTMQMRAAMYTI